MEGQINDLHGHIDKNQEDAKKLRLGYDDELGRYGKHKGTLRGLDDWRRLNDDLIKKLRRLRGDIDSQNDLNRAMQKNPDYDYEQPDIMRLADKLQEFTNRADRDDAARKKLDGKLGPIKDKCHKGVQLPKVDVERYYGEVTEAVKELEGLHTDVDGMQGSLDKKRKKQHDHKINDHIDVRPVEAKECTRLLEKAKDKLQRLKQVLKQPELPGSSPNRGKDQVAKRTRENEKLLNLIQKDLEPVSAHADELKPKYAGRDFPKEECRMAVGPVQEVMRVGVELQKIKERIEEVDGDIEADFAMAQSPEQKDRMIEDMLMKVKTQDHETDFLRKKNEFELKERLIDRPLAVDLKSVQHSLNYLEDINGRIGRLGEIMHIRKPE